MPRRSDIDDPAARPRLHAGQQQTSQPRERRDVDVDHFALANLIQGLEATDTAEARIVYQQVDCMPGLMEFVAQAFRSIRVGKVRRYFQHAGAVPILKFRGKLRQPIRPSRRDN